MLVEARSMAAKQVAGQSAKVLSNDAMHHAERTRQRKRYFDSSPLPLSHLYDS
jgi:hypothetical protein